MTLPITPKVMEVSGMAGAGGGGAFVTLTGREVRLTCPYRTADVR